ncbi:MAG: hypothetical protein JXD19_04905 [Deltaproteobacteria bacterium]|nr:hypothetical protein [Deltaproteobacteria bacterium]
MDEGSIIIVNLQNPKEKVVGKLLSISPSGLTIRGIDVNSFKDWMMQFTHAELVNSISPTTAFYPMHRVISCYLDEDSGEILSLASQFKERTHKDIREVL